MNIELLSWFGNLINFLVFTYIAISIVNTACFNVFQMSLSLVGLLASIFIQIVSVTARYSRPTTSSESFVAPLTPRILTVEFLGALKNAKRKRS